MPTLEIAKVCHCGFGILILNPHFHVTGDSGGAITGLAMDQKKIKYVQYGIVSAGLAECGTANSGFGIYTKVSTFLQWILDHVD